MSEKELKNALSWAIAVLRIRRMNPLQEAYLEVIRDFTHELSTQSQDASRQPSAFDSIADSLAKLANPIITLNAEPSPLNQLATAILDGRLSLQATDLGISE